MKRYIDPIDLKKDLLLANILAPDKTLEEIIDDVTAADVRENIHAKWISKHNKLECSACHGRVYLGTKDLGIHEEEKECRKFCSHCGAIMDLK